MKKIKVSVYIVSHNYGKYLNEAIESVLRQKFDSWELLLVNADSTDNTQDILSVYGGDPKIRVFKIKSSGLAAAANFCLKHARGEYIMRLDADDVLDENMLLILSNYLDRSPEISLVFPDYFLVDGQGGVIKYEGRQTVYSSNHMLDIPANGACTLVRSKVLKKVGGYREDLKAQDGLDLWTKVLRQYKCANVNLPLFYYRRHGLNITDDQTRIFNARRIIKKDACLLNLSKHRPISAIIPCRRHYDVYPDIWSKKINDKTLLELAVLICLKSSIFDKIIVTADNPAVQEVMSGIKDSRLKFVERNKELTINSRSIVHTLEYLIKDMRLNSKGVSVISYIQSPFIKTESLEEAVYTLILNNADSAFAVEEMPEQLYKRTAHGLSPVNPPGKLRSDFDVIYAEAMAAAAVKNSNIRTGSLTGARIAHFVIPGEEAFFIQTKRDLEIARMLLSGKI